MDTNNSVMDSGLSFECIPCKALICTPSSTYKRIMIS
nr:MAG TPA: hypothetical protein [Caudoviricetes sp.]